MEKYSHEIINDDTRLQLNFMLTESNNYYSPLHWHGHLEIIFIQKGKMAVYINDRKYMLKENDMLVVGSKELHSTRTWGDTDYLLLQIPIEYLSRVLNQVPLIQFQEYFPSITGNSSSKNSSSRNDSQSELYHCLLALAETYKNKEDGYLLHFSSVVYEFLYLLYKNHSRRISPQVKERENHNFERMEVIIAYVKAHYKEDISLNDAAKLVNLSPEHFCRLFKKHTGQTFLAYVNAVRLIHFHQELLATDYSINELMERSGITNYKVFIRLFKETYGTTPGKLRTSRLV